MFNAPDHNMKSHDSHSMMVCVSSWGGAPSHPALERWLFRYPPASLGYPHGELGNLHRNHHMNFPWEVAYWMRGVSPWLTPQSSWWSDDRISPSMSSLVSSPRSLHFLESSMLFFFTRYSAAPRTCKLFLVESRCGDGGWRWWFPVENGVLSCFIPLKKGFKHPFGDGFRNHPW